LIIVILKINLSNDKKYANFNVSFEFGYARVFNEKKEKIILFLDGNLDELPFDIKRDNAISLQDVNYISEIEKCITEIEEKEFEKLKESPDGIKNWVFV